MAIYTQDFFTDIQGGSQSSAQIIAPLILQFFQPSSVVDVGCGTGSFLLAFQESGVSNILGIDGDYVDRRQLVVPQACFRPVDLALPFTLETSYDLAVCLEVAEHLAPDCAENFIASLVQLAPVILFSAAIPHQGGVHHVNLQWPEYWASLFAKHGYVAVDALRKRIWNNPQVEWWYRQNALLFCAPSALADNPRLQEERAMTFSMLSVVHPDLYSVYAKRLQERIYDSLSWKVKNLFAKVAYR